MCASRTFLQLAYNTIYHLRQKTFPKGAFQAISIYHPSLVHIVHRIFFLWYFIVGLRSRELCRSPFFPNLKLWIFPLDMIGVCQKYSSSINCFFCFAVSARNRQIVDDRVCTHDRSIVWDPTAEQSWIWGTPKKTLDYFALDNLTRVTVYVLKHDLLENGNSN